MPRTIDAFIAFNEIDMILTRMHILKDVVDMHVIVEAAVTHSGEQRETLVVRDAILDGVFNEFRHKIQYHVVAVLEGGNSWARERYHRSSLSDGIQGCASEGDLIIVADADEIPNPDALATVGADGARLAMDMYYYDFNHRVRQEWGIGVLPYTENMVDANDIRTAKYHQHLPLIENGGWHASFFMTPEKVVQKVQSYMHHADIAANMPRDPAWVAERMKRGEDLFGRGIQIDYIPHPEGLPAYVLANRERYTALGWLEA